MATEAAAVRATPPSSLTNAVPQLASPIGSMGGGTTSLGPRTFIHPGIPLTKDDLDEVKRNIEREPWKSAFEALKRDPEAQLDRKMYGPFDTVSRTPDINLTPWKRDMSALYKLSLMWYLTGNEAYAQKGHDLLMAYVKGQKSFTGAEMYLSLGDFAHTVLGGADILRGTWPGWTAEDTVLSKAYFRNIYAAGWTPNPLRSANQGALLLINFVCVSVYLDDSEMFNECVRMFLSDPETALTDTLPNGELGDTGRDQGHAAGQLVRTLLAAEVFWKQGVDVYSARDNRLLAMGEFYARFNLNYPTPFMPFGTKYALYRVLLPLPRPGKPSTMIGSMIYKAYTIRMGLSAPYSAQVIATNPIDFDAFLYYKIADHSTALPPPSAPEPAPTEPLTDGLDNAEIGNASPDGSGAYSGGTWTIRGGGTATKLKPPWVKWAWRVEDSCHFAYRKVTGDATLIARVTSVDEVQDFSMAGLMIRDSIEPTVARMLVWLTPNARNGPSVETDLRGFSASSHGSSFQIHENAVIPYWLKLERVGDRITCWNSPDGASWTPIENGLFPGMSKTACLGLFVCSTMNGKTATARFDNVRITGGGGIEQLQKPAAPCAIYGGPGDGQVPLRWLESFGATSYKVKRSATEGGPYQTIAAVKGTSLVDKAVENGKTYYYVVSATNSGGESPNSLEDSVTPVTDAAAAPSSLSNADLQPAAVADSTDAAPVDPEPGASTNTAPAEVGTVNPSPIGITGENSTSSDLTPKDKAGAFVHPGLLHSDVDFARMREHLHEEPWADGWAKLIANRHASLDWQPHPIAVVVRGKNHELPQNYGGLYNDIAAAYACALRWKISGDTRYADKSVEIMNAWSSTLTKITGSTDADLAAGIYGYEFANAAEIMRSYPGWKAEDFARFQGMMLNVFYTINHDFLVRHNGTPIDHYWANWDLCNMDSILAIGVLCDRRDLYNEAIDYFKHGDGNGAIEHAVYYIHPVGLGQWQESGRDQGHSTLGIGLMGAFCEMAWKQGDDLYGYDNNRFLAGCEYVAKYNLGEDVPFKPFQDSLATQDVISPAGRGVGRPIWELIYNHYVKLKGLPAPYVTKAAETVRPEGGGGDYGPNSGGFDQLGYGTLTATLP